MNPLGEFLGPAARMAREGLSANAALKQLQQAGLGIRRTDFLKSYGELTQSVNARNSLLGLPIGGRPESEQISHFQSSTARGFQHIVQVQSVNRETNELTTRRISVLSENLLTREEAEQMALTRHEEENYEADSVTIALALEEVRSFGPGE